MHAQPMTLLALVALGVGAVADQRSTGPAADQATRLTLEVVQVTCSMEQAAEINLEQIAQANDPTQLVKRLSAYGTPRLVFRADEQCLLQAGRPLVIRPGKSVPLNRGQGGDVSITYENVGTAMEARGEWLDIRERKVCAMTLSVDLSGVGRAVPGQAEAQGLPTFDSCKASRLLLIENGRPATLLFTDYPVPGPDGKPQVRAYVVRVGASLLP